MAQGAMWALYLAVLQRGAMAHAVKPSQRGLIEGLGVWHSRNREVGGLLGVCHGLLRGWYLHTRRPRVADGNQPLLEETAGALLACREHTRHHQLVVTV